MYCMNAELAAKRARLEAHLRSLGRLLVAYSGGVDSAFLADVACQVLGMDMLAVIEDSPSLARSQLDDAKDFAAERGIPVARWQRQNLYFGGVQAVARNPKSGELSGGGDPRRGGAVVVV